MLREFQKKYYLFGSFSGKVTLKNITIQDIEALEGFFGKNYHGKKSISISAELFLQTLEKSRFSGIKLEELITEFFQKPLTIKKEEVEIKEAQIRTILLELAKEYEGTPAASWILLFVEILGKKEQENLEEWKRKLRLGADIVNHFPYRQQKNVYLAVFSASLTGNPHTFDRGTEGGSFLYKIIEKDLEQRGIFVEKTALFQAYKRQRTYLAVGIMVDDLSNYALLYQVQAKKKNGEEHFGMKGFCQEQDVVQVPLGVIANWEGLHCAGQEIYIVENPSVFALLCAEHRENEKACMCMNGQPRLAGLLVLELLAKSGTKVYYAGDFDPEGLLIAQKLSKHYNGEFHFWNMDVESYEKSKSKEAISEKRLKMLDLIMDERLKPVAEKMASEKVAGYQENLIKEGFDVDF